MMSKTSSGDAMTLLEALSALHGRDVLDAEAVLAVRQAVYAPDGAIDAQEAEAIFRLNADAGRISSEWRAFFCEAIADYMVRQADPPGFIVAEKADWLMGCVERFGAIREDEVEMLLHLLETADDAPAAFDAFVLQIIKRLSLHEIGRHGRLSGIDVERLRRAVFAGAGEGGASVTRGEGEVLFEIHHALPADQRSDPWRAFFVGALCNAVQYVRPWTPDRDRERADERWLEARGFEGRAVNPLRMRDMGDFRHAVDEALSEMAHLDGPDHDVAGRFAADEALERDAAQIDAGEAAWLLDRLGPDWREDAVKVALLTALRDSGARIAPPLAALVAELPGSASQRLAS